MVRAYNSINSDIMPWDVDASDVKMRLVLLNMLKFCCTMILLVHVSSVSAKEPNDQLLDLRDYDFISKEGIRLDTVWSFHWHQLLDPSDSLFHSSGIDFKDGLNSWTTYNSWPAFGYGTYFAKIILPSPRPMLSLQIPKIYSSARVWINHDIVFESGKVGTNKQSTRHSRYSGIVPIVNDQDTVMITVQVANYYHRKAGMTKAMLLAETRQLWAKDRVGVMSDMMLIGSLTFIGVSFLILFCFYWNKDLAILYFSLLCLCWAYRDLSDGYAPVPYIFEGFPWVWHVKLEYISLFFGSLMGILFLDTIFKAYFHPLYARSIKLVVYILIALIIFLPDYYGTFLLIPFFVLMSANISYIVVKLIQIKKKERLQARLGLFGVFSGLVVVSFHMYDYSFLNEKNNVLLSIGYMFVFMINSLLLGKRFSVSFRSLKLLQHRTQEQKEEIAYQAQLLNKANDLLEEKVTERTKELERTVEEVNERNTNLEQFNYIISHNMRAPLANIRGLLNLYNRSEAGSAFNETIIDQLEDSCQRLDVVLKDLTGILEIKYGLQESRQRIVFEDLVNKIKMSIKKDIDQSSVRFELDFQEPFIKSIESYWYSIFINLITNAIKYKKPGKAVTIKIKSWQDGDKTILAFEDNGIGIDMKKNGNKVFGLYKRFHDHVEGKGMGLFMVKTQLESIGGKIQLTSKPNRGCVFTIEVSNQNEESL